MKPKKIGLAFNVGVTGHRSINSSEKQSLEKLTTEILEVIAEECKEIYKEVKEFYSSDEPKLRLITSIAEGFDRIAAKTSLDLGYEIQCPLPFSREEYSKDFENEESKAEYYSLLERASSVYELDFGRDALDKHYLNAGTIMIEQSDILIAFWDGAPAKGPGGTGDIVELAGENGIPVLVINRNMEVLFGREHEWKEKIKKVVKSILMPCDNIHDLNSFPYLYLNEELGRRRNARTYNYILRLFSSKSNRNDNLNEELKSNGGESHDICKTEKGYFNSFFVQADELAVFYSDYYRSAGALRALIPLFANIALAVGFYWRWGENPNIVNVIGFLVQAILLYWLIRIVGERNEKNKWHQKFIDYRILAECVKNQSYAVLFGITLREIQITAYNKSDEISWVNWYIRGIDRGIGLPDMKIDKKVVGLALDDFNNNLLLDQRKYHSKNAEKMSGAGKRLEKVGVAFFTAGALFTIVRVIIHYVCQIYPKLVWFPNPDNKIIKLPVLINMLSLLLPAFGAVMFAIGTQAGFDKLAQRHSYMEEQLRNAAHVVRKLKEESFLQTRKWVLNVVKAMINEVGDWRMFIKGKGISKR